MEAQYYMESTPYNQKIQRQTESMDNSFYSYNYYGNGYTHSPYLPQYYQANSNPYFASNLSTTSPQASFSYSPDSLSKSSQPAPYSGYLAVANNLQHQLFTNSSPLSQNSYYSMHGSSPPSYNSSSSSLSPSFTSNQSISDVSDRKQGRVDSEASVKITPELMSIEGKYLFRFRDIYMENMHIPRGYYFIFFENVCWKN